MEERTRRFMMSWLIILIYISLGEWVNVDSLKVVVNRERVSEFWMDKEGNFRVNALRDSVLLHYIISSEGRVKQITGYIETHKDERLYLVETNASRFLRKRVELRRTFIPCDRILLSQEMVFLWKKSDFLLYEYRINREEKKIKFSRTIIFPGEKIYKLRLGRYYTTWVNQGAPLIARLVALGEDYAMIHIAAYDTIWAVPPPPGVEFMRYPPYPQMFYIIIFKLEELREGEFRTRIYKIIPITHEDDEDVRKKIGRQNVDFVQGCDKDGNLYYVTFRDKPYKVFYHLKHLSKPIPVYRWKYVPDFAVRILLSDSLKNLKIGKFSLEEFKETFKVKENVKKTIRQYDAHFPRIPGLPYPKGRGLITIFNDTLVFYFQNYMGILVFGENNLNMVKDIAHLTPVELTYSDFVRHKNDIELRYRVNTNTLFLHFLSPQGIFYHKEFKLVE